MEKKGGKMARAPPTEKSLPLPPIEDRLAGFKLGPRGGQFPIFSFLLSTGCWQ